MNFRPLGPHDVPFGHVDPKALEQEIQLLADQPDWVFEETVGNYVRRPNPLRRAALHSDHLASRTMWALNRLNAEAMRRVEVEASNRERGNLAAFAGLVQDERRAVQPRATQALLLTTRRGPVFEALLLLMAENQPRFQELLRQVKKDRKKRPKPIIKAPDAALHKTGTTLARDR